MSAGRTKRGSSSHPPLRALSGIAVRLLKGSLLVAILIAAWWAATEIWEIPSYLIPPPRDVWTSFSLSPQFFLSNVWVTTTEIVLGLGLAIVGAVCWALLLVSVTTIRRAVFPLMVAAQSAPKEALAPIFIIWWGFSPMPKIVMAALIAFFPMLVATVVGLERFTEEQRLLAASMGAGRLRSFFSFRLWVALPSFLGGVKLGVTLAAIGAVLGEYLGSDKGIGYLILSSSRVLNGGLLYASLIALIVLSLILVKLVDLTQHWMLRGMRAGRYIQ